jgi:hypothetical protein
VLWHRKFLIATTCVVVGALVPSVYALAPAAPATSKITWLAAGDSYSSGAGLPVTTGLCNRADSSAHPEAYAPDAYVDLRTSLPTLNRPTFVACSGATSADFLRNKDSAGRPEWTSAMGRFDLVTFTFGGDNVNFAGILAQCVLGGDPIAPPDPGHRCPSNAFIQNEITAQLGVAYQSFLKKVADEAVTSGGNIVVLGYPDLIEPPARWTSILRHLGRCQGISTSDATQLRSEAADLNAAINQDVNVVNAQHPNGVTITFLNVNSGSDPGPITVSKNDKNLFEPSQVQGHNLCGTGSPWLNGIVLFDKHKSFHPSALGNEAEGRLLAQLIPHLPGIGTQAVGTTTTTAPTSTSTTTTTTTTVPTSTTTTSTTTTTTTSPPVTMTAS